MKKRIFSFLLCAVLLIGLLSVTASSSASFSDVKSSDWFADAVTYAVDNGLMNGTGNDQFSPNGDMTRAMLVTVLWRFEGSEDVGYSDFSDIVNSHWYAKAVAWASKNQIVNGVGGGKFDPNGNVTREQMAAILYRFSDMKGIDTSKGTALASFPDGGKVSTYALDAMKWAVGEGLINGADGKLMPQGNATRAQVATILMRFIKNVVGGTNEDENNPSSEWKVALICEYGAIDDQSYNQATWEACLAFCEDYDIELRYYRPCDDSTTGRVACIGSAVAEGFNVIVMPGYSFGGAIAESAPKYPDVKFIGLDITKGDLLESAVYNAGEIYDYVPDNWDIEDYIDMSNIYCTNYREEISGFMAGYAAVKLGYTKLGFLGGMAVPMVIRYGNGFVQGADTAAVEEGISIEINYGYGGQFFGDADITHVMDTWYAGGTEVVFACGGGIFTSVAEAAAKFGGKVIGVDVDQAAMIDGLYGEGITLTSAMKGLAPTTYDTLKDIIINGNEDRYFGKIENLGLVSAEALSKNYVQLPLESTLWNDSFTQNDYADLVAGLMNGKYIVSDDASYDYTPETLNTTVTFCGTIHG